MTGLSTTMTQQRKPSSWLAWLWAAALAVALTYLFWTPLWHGGTLIGGDTFSYYFPQKLFLSESLQRGEFPLWNPWVGAGYPIVAESQTGVLYPPTLLFYRYLDVHVAYSVNQLLHYVIAFLGMYAVGGRYGLSRASCLLAAVVYVYGWFAPRICLEWAIIGGAYLPWCVWIVERWLASGRRRDVLWLGPVLGLFLLAGHFHLAFITTLALSLYVTLRVMISGNGAVATPSTSETRLDLNPSTPSRWARLLTFGGVLITGYVLAAIQLGPTLELMSRSQRQELTAESDPGYGHIPPWYLTQIFSSWIWYHPDTDPDQSLFHVGALAYPSATNKVEAHLYFGMVPLLLVLGTIAAGVLQRQWPFPRAINLWLLIGLLGVGLATGWPLVVLKHVPGFGYFRGAGRYSVLMSFAMALAAGSAWDRWFSQSPNKVIGRGLRTGLRSLIWIAVLGLTTWDLYFVSRWVTYAVMLESPILPMRETSEIREVLSLSSQPVRLWCPGSNAATLLGQSAFPVYLGLGPREYFDPQWASTFDEKRDGDDPVAITRQVDWLRRNGVTHIVSFDPLDETQWTSKLVYRGFDQLLCRVWARYDSPLFLYEIENSPGRIVDASGRAIPVSQWRETANGLSLTVRLDSETTLVVRELSYPGWTATMDGADIESRTVGEMYREISVPAGTHQIQWRYRPISLWWGAGTSALAVIAWCVIYLRSADRHSRSTTT